jgi:hypothetical protein
VRIPELPAVLLDLDEVRHVGQRQAEQAGDDRL